MATSTLRPGATAWALLRAENKAEIQAECKILKDTKSGVVIAVPGSPLKELGADASKWVVDLSGIEIGYAVVKRSCLYQTVPRSWKRSPLSFTDGTPSLAALDIGYT